ncbi:RDD family protein [Paenibacillus prosopidis]|uniref:Putative RDD family membrane protein YckC n=1 Tax=Paenibacillus prosopidis TaxID=630520 RepID=A0A368W7D3_9BACL|nr:RDD family protein [Paenibacillus prosopidis]RCW51318.1 putative RDD family membrane protein YckC [Paenibacillus prosopidis]
MNAGFWIRLGASLLDGLIVGLPLYLLSLLISGGPGGEEYFTDVISFLYSLLLPVFWNGYTIGKRICGIQIRKLDGSAPRLGTMILRNVVGGLIYALTLGIAAIVSAFMVGLREDKRAIHDFIAGTEVLYDK